jgi:hypothetical protein
MFHIFREELDSAFRAEGKLVWKLLGAIAVGVGIGLEVWLRLSNDEHIKGLDEHIKGLFGCLCCMGAITVACVGAVLALSLKDVVKRRIYEGRPVSLLLRWYLASGLWSLGLWIATVMLGLFLVALCGDL